MKPLSFALVLYFGCVAFSCHKNVAPASAVSDSTLIIKFKNCESKVFNSQTVMLCFDSLLTDSRCPKNVDCVWAGTAVAKFSFTVNNIVYPVSMATLKIKPFPADTITAGYKLKFTNLFPYPDVTAPPFPPGDRKAEVQIIKQ